MTNQPPAPTFYDLLDRAAAGSAIQAKTCGRPRTDGVPCRQKPVPWPGRMLAFLNSAPPPTPHFQSCGQHMTDPERDELQHLRAAEKAALHEGRLALQRPIACWSWPISDEIWQRLAKAADPALSQEEADGLAWDVLADWQDERCAICGRPDRVLDHDHETGLIRGWLCRKCNQHEGNAGDDQRDIYVAYRTCNPATILGIRLVYVDKLFGPALATPPPEG